MALAKALSRPPSTSCYSATALSIFLLSLYRLPVPPCSPCLGRPWGPNGHGAGCGVRLKESFPVSTDSLETKLKAQNMSWVPHAEGRG